MRSQERIGNMISVYSYSDHDVSKYVQGKPNSHCTLYLNLPSFNIKIKLFRDFNSRLEPSKLESGIDSDTAIAEIHPLNLPGLFVFWLLCCPIGYLFLASSVFS